MPKILFFCFLLLVKQNSYAQKIRFTDKSNEWTVFHTLGRSLPPTSHTSLLKYSIDGDTSIGGINYKITGFGLIREDTILNRVYVRYGRTADRISFDTTEMILYDFGMKLGDTQTFNFSHGSYVLDKIDSTVIRGVFHKIFYFNSNYNGSFDAIEGIGSTAGPYFSMDPDILDKESKLCAFKNDGIRHIPNPSVKGYYNTTFTNTESCVLSVSEVSAVINAVTIIPNPANENSFIKLPYNMHSGTLVLTNTLGEIIRQQVIADKTELPIGVMDVPGLYYYHVIDKQTGRNYTGKFIYN